MQKLIRAWAAATIQFLDLTIEVSGIEHVEADVVAPLHEGFADVLALSRFPSTFAMWLATSCRTGIS